MPSPVYQYVINLVVSIPIRRGPGVQITYLVIVHYIVLQQLAGNLILTRPNNGQGNITLSKCREKRVFFVSEFIHVASLVFL